MDEATQLHVMFPVQGQLQLLDCQAIIMLRMMRRKSRRRQRSCWVRSWLSSERRLLYGHYSRLTRELRVEDQASFFNFLRMPPEMFDELLTRIGPRIHKQDILYRKALAPGLKLAVTIRHLASGWQISITSVRLQSGPQHHLPVGSRSVPGYCRRIHFRGHFVSYDARRMALHCRRFPIFHRRWNVPHACGAIDGKHVAIRCPQNSGSLFHNYKGFFSVLLIAVVDADYKFLRIDVGGYGSQSDAQIYNESELKECLEDGSIGFPDADQLPTIAVQNDNAQNATRFL